MAYKRLAGMWTFCAVALVIGASTALGQSPIFNDTPADSETARGGDQRRNIGGPRDEEDTRGGAKKERPSDGRDGPRGRGPRVPDRPGFSESFGPRPDGFGPPFGPGRLRGGEGRGPIGLDYGPGSLSRLDELKKSDPEMYELERRDIELERQTLELSLQYRRSPRDQRDATKKQLAETVERHFEARQARRQLQFKRLEEELNRMRATLEQRTELRGKIVERRVMELTGEQHELDF